MYNVSAYDGITIANTDIIPTLQSVTSYATETNLGFVLKKITVIVESETRISINGQPYFPMYQDSDGKYKLSLDKQDVLISSLKFETSGINYYIAFIF